MLTFSWHEINNPLYESPSVSVGPSDLRLLGVRDSLSAGQPHEVRCEAVGARPAPLITWWRGETQLTQGVSKPQVREQIQEKWFIQSAHNSALIVSGISQGFNHTKCFLIFHGWNLVSFQILQIATLLNSDQNMHSISFNRLTFENVQFIPFYRQVLMEMWRWALYGSLPR